MSTDLEKVLASAKRAGEQKQTSWLMLCWRRSPSQCRQIGWENFFGKLFAVLPVSIGKPKFFSGAAVMSTDLEKFIGAAKRGSEPRCSSLEHAAQVAADAVLETIFEFDDSYVRGLVTFIGVAKVNVERARELLD